MVGGIACRSARPQFFDGHVSLSFRLFGTVFGEVPLETLAAVTLPIRPVDNKDGLTGIIHAGIALNLPADVGYY